MRAPHTSSFWGNLMVNIIIIVLFEALVIGVAGLIVRRRFDRGLEAKESPALAEPLVAHPASTASTRSR